MLERMWRKGKPPILLVGLKINTATVENSMEVPQKTKNRITIWSGNHTPGHISRQKSNSKRYLHPCVHSRTIHNSQDLKTTWISIDRLMGKESACIAGHPGSIPGWERPLEKEMETHPNILAWRMPWTEEPGRLQSTGSQRVGHI